MLIDIGQTYGENEILLTGAGGFLGKVVLGLLLDRYPEFKHVHVLLRPRPNRPASERFESEVVGSPALRSVVEKRGKDFLRQKITVWPGDLGQAQCGLSPCEVEKLAGRLRLIVNCAGRVDFFAPLDESFSSNVDGVENLIALAKRLNSRLLHVSTCFVCGGTDGLIEETDPILGFYPRRKGPDDTSFNAREEIDYCRGRIREVYQSAESSAPADGGRAGEEVRQRLIALGKQRAESWGWVNTYTYTKALGEQLLAAEPGLEFSIVRPGIIESALRFPFPGWIEGSRTSAPLVLMALGGLKDWPMRPDIPLEVVPVDLAASALLVVGAALLNGRHTPVCQLATAHVNPVSLEQIVSWLEAVARRDASRNGKQPLGVRLVRPRGKVRFLSAEEARARRVRFQRRVRRVEDLAAWARTALDRRRLPGRGWLGSWVTALRTLGLQATFREQALEQYLPFILDHSTVFESENIRAAYAMVTEKDRELLPWDPERIDWNDYWVKNQIEGIEKWVQPEAVRDWAFRV